MIEVEDWPDRAAFEAWWLANVRAFNALAIEPPPDPLWPEGVRNEDWRMIAEYIHRWKTKHGL